MNTLSLKIFYIISLIGISIGIIIGILTIYWLIYPYKTMDFQDEVAKLNTNEVKRGEYITYTLNYCKYINKDALITRKFIDGIEYTVTDGYSDLDVGCGTREVQVYVPRGLYPGDYRIKQNNHYQLNPIREVDVFIYTEWFKVI